MGVIYRPRDLCVGGTRGRRDPNVPDDGTSVSIVSHPTRPSPPPIEGDSVETGRTVLSLVCRGSSRTRQSVVSREGKEGKEGKEEEGKGKK